MDPWAFLPLGSIQNTSKGLHCIHIKFLQLVPENNTWNDITVCCWNIRRGLIKRENEIKALATQHNLSILFLVETDTFNINEEKDYQIANFNFKE